MNSDLGFGQPFEERIVTRIRPIALGCFIRAGQELLVVHGFDDHKQEEFFRFAGGGIEFGETGAEALQREIREELSQEIHNLRHVGFFENIFTYRGKPHHEMVQVYLAEFVNPDAYQRERMQVIENREAPDHSIASWLPIEDFRTGRRILYPAGVLETLDGSTALAGTKSPVVTSLSAPVLLRRQVAEALLAACPEAGARKFLVDHLIAGAENLTGACHEFTATDVSRYVLSPEISLAAARDHYPQSCHYHTIKTEIYLGSFSGLAIWQLGHPEPAVVRGDFEGVVIIPPGWCHLMKPKPMLAWTLQIPNPVGNDKHEVPMPPSIAAQMAASLLTR